jgi:DNA-binding CsgD family transcriptional regulator
MPRNPNLTPSETEITELLCNNRDAAQIAEILGYETATIRLRIRSAKKKLDVTTNQGLCAKFYQLKQQIR